MARSLLTRLAKICILQEEKYNTKAGITMQIICDKRMKGPIALARITSRQ
jgi:hypothetical protein